MSQSRRKAPATGVAGRGRLVTLLLAAACLGSGALLLRHRVAAGLWALLALARNAGPAGWGLAALAQLLVAATGILPASLIGIAAGTVYGVLPGFLLAGAGTLGGALVSFLLSRSLARPLVARWLERRGPGRRAWLARLDGAIARDGWRTVCLLRLSPAMPFAATSYALGLTGVSRRDYLLGTLASLPALLGYVVLGHLAGAGLSAALTGASLIRWALLAVGILATVALTIRIGRLTRAVGLDNAMTDGDAS